MELKPADFGASKLIHLKFSPVWAKIKRSHHHFALKKKPNKLPAILKATPWQQKQAAVEG